MKKYMLLVALFIGAAITATAQHTQSAADSEDKGFWNNTFVSAGIGGQLLFGDHEKQMKFGHRIAPELGIAVGKWFKPGLGVRLMYTGWALNGATQDSNLGNGKPLPNKPWHGYWLYEQDIKYMNLHADVMFNIHDLFCAYKADRVWNCSPYAGLGWIHTNNNELTNNMSVHLGIFNAFRLTDTWDLNLDLHTTITHDDFDAESGGRNAEGILGLTIGATYKFNTFRK